MILKRKYRYVLVVSSGEVDANRSASGILGELMRFMGELSYADANPRIAAQYSPTLFVIKMNRNSEDAVILALSFVKQAQGKVGFASVKTSGTIKTLLSYANSIKDQ